MFASDKISLRQRDGKCRCYKGLQSLGRRGSKKKTIEMFWNPENYDLFERKKSRSVNSYFDELYFGTQEE